MSTEPVPPSHATRPARPRALVFALAASLALNLFAIGFFAARAMRPRFGDRERHGPFLGPRGLLADDIEPKARAIVDRVMSHHRQEMKQEHRELRAARRAVRDALEAEPFEKRNLERALSSLRARTEASQARLHGALVELADALPKQHRKQLARRAHVLEGKGPSGRHEHRH